MTDPRVLAEEVITAALAGQGHSRELLDAALGASDLEPRDRGLATELVYGVLRRQITLDYMIGRFAATGRVAETAMPPMRVAAYQILYLDRVPARAAIFCAVDRVRFLAGEKKAGFANGLLRSLARAVAAKLPVAVVAKEDPRTVLPLDGERALLLDKPFLPDSAHETDRYLSITWSVPAWLVARWRANLGEAAARTALRACAETPPAHLRPNCLKVSPAELSARLVADGLAWEPGPHGLIRLCAAGDPMELPVFREGLVSIQDATSQAVVAALDPQPGETVLDLCAAPGTKSAACAERMGNRGLVLACDLSPARLARLAVDLPRLGITCVRPVAADGLRVAVSPSFDRVLVDAPCSNTGVLRRRPEVRGRLRASDLPHAAERQLALLSAGATALAPGGTLVYATCSIEPEENQGVVTAFLAAHPGWSLVEERLTVPEPGAGDGGYFAKLRTINVL